jgi:hypothetical protein
MLVPSFDIAIALQSRDDALAVQVTPESVETYIGPFWNTAAILVPSLDIEIPYQVRDDSLCVHVAPESIDVYILPL